MHPVFGKLTAHKKTKAQEGRRKLLFPHKKPLYLFHHGIDDDPNFSSSNDVQQQQQLQRPPRQYRKKTHHHNNNSSSHHHENRRRSTSESLGRSDQVYCNHYFTIIIPIITITVRLEQWWYCGIGTNQRLRFATCVTMFQGRLSIPESFVTSMEEGPSTTESKTPSTAANTFPIRIFAMRHVELVRDYYKQ